MVKHKKLIWGLLMITLAVTSCSKGNDDVTESGLRYDMSKPNYEKPTTAIPSLDYSFRGVWTVDNSAVDTVDVRVITGENVPKYGADGRTPLGFTYMNFVAYYGFPLMEIMKKIAPDVNVAKITYDMRVGGLLPADEALLLQTIVAHGDNNVIITAYKLTSLKSICVKASPKVHFILYSNQQMTICCSIFRLWSQPIKES